MNSLFIPALAGQIYAMPGMQTRLHAVMNHAGDYDGFSANYSGAGFSDMHFMFHGMTTAISIAGCSAPRPAPPTLGREGYLQLERPSENEPVRRICVMWRPACTARFSTVAVERRKRWRQRHVPMSP